MKNSSRQHDSDAHKAMSEPAEVDMWQPKSQQNDTMHDRYLGCMLGGAVGDALGAPVEFVTLDEITSRFGPQGIQEYAPAFGRIGAITDDTQMTLFTAEGLIRGWIRGCDKGITSLTSVTSHAYQRWLFTQGVPTRHNHDANSNEPGWLIQQRALHSRRAPGNTCLSALSAMERLGDPAHNNSKGCGGVMRVAPVGLFGWYWQEAQNPVHAFNLGTELAALTHGHPTGSLTAGVLAVLIMALVDGLSLKEALIPAKACLKTAKTHQETMAALELAERLAASDVPPRAAISQLGQGWVAEEALAIAAYCSLVAKDFREGVILAVNHDGDSDSTGTITGNILGTLYGVKAIPESWLKDLELRDVIESIAQDLFEVSTWFLWDDATRRQQLDRIWNKYPGY